MDALIEAVDSAAPGALLSLTSAMLSELARDDDPASSLDELVRTLSGIDRTEMSAALLAIATLTVDADLRRRVRREIADRGHVLPRWLAELNRTSPVNRAVEVSTVFRAVDELLVAVTVPGGHDVTAVVVIDNERGAVTTDAFVAEVSLQEAIERVTPDGDQDRRIRDIAPADARARILAALQAFDKSLVPIASDTVPRLRPLIEWMVALLPEGGESHVLLDLADDELDELADRFLASPFGVRWSDDERRDLLDDLLGYGTANGLGDPLVWSARNARRVLRPSLLHFDLTPCSDLAPDLLRDLIRYGHAERGIRVGLTRDALAAVDRYAGDFLEAVRRQDVDD